MGTGEWAHSEARWGVRREAVHPRHQSQATGCTTEGSERMNEVEGRETRRTAHLKDVKELVEELGRDGESLCTEDATSARMSLSLA